MSKYVIARLDGCDVQECAREASYIDYEIYNKTLVELQFAHHSSGIRYSTLGSSEKYRRLCRGKTWKVMISSLFLSFNILLISPRTLACGDPNRVVEGL